MTTQELKTYLALHEAKLHINKAMIALLESGLIDDKAIKETYFVLRSCEGAVTIAYKNAEDKKYPS